MAPPSEIRNGLSFDIEEWFHILNLPTSPAPDSWSSLRVTVVRNTDRLLEILEANSVHATFFVLGWIARQHPLLVRRIADAGHEIACHGDMHELCYEQGPLRFEEDLRRARGSLGDLVGAPIEGYRAPGFSILAETPWAFEAIARQGFVYDSSIFPAQRQHGGDTGAPVHPHAISLSDGSQLAEFPMTVAGWGPLRFAVAGGGYLRLLPYPMVRWGIRRMNRAGHPGCVYLHPREVDPGHPRVEMPLGRRFRSYVNLASTVPKLTRLLREFRFAPLRDVLREHGLIDAAPRK
ncbi:MAG: XrtA system polysaccharide deacetylase [Myxococcota bacterium]